MVNWLAPSGASPPHQCGKALPYPRTYHVSLRLCLSPTPERHSLEVNLDALPVRRSHTALGRQAGRVSFRSGRG